MLKNIKNKLLHASITRMCSPAVSTLDSPAIDRSSNPNSGKILMSENVKLYTTSPVVKVVKYNCTFRIILQSSLN